MNQDIVHPFGGKTQQFKTEFCGNELIIETGKMAFLADGAVTVRYGDTVVLSTAVVSNQPTQMLGILRIYYYFNSS